MNKLIQISLAALALTVFSACHTTKLEPGGAYALTNTVPDMAFFAVDSSYDLAYSTIDAAFKFERDNRLMLWNVSPNIKHTLDAIRPKAVEADAAYLRSRAAYIANPTPTGLTVLQEILSKTQALAVSAQAALPKGK